MQNLKTINNQAYPTALLRVYRSLQIGQQPNSEDVERAAQLGWNVLINNRLFQGRLEEDEAPVMSEADKQSIVHQWLAQTQGWLRLRAGYDAGRLYDQESILILAEGCTWASLEDVSGLPDVQQGKMHPTCLELGLGNRKAAYRHDKLSSARVYFFTAYKS